MKVVTVKELAKQFENSDLLCINCMCNPIRDALSIITSQWPLHHSKIAIPCKWMLYIFLGTRDPLAAVTKKQIASGTRVSSNKRSIWAFDLGFDHFPIKISEKGKHFQFILFCEEFKSTIRMAKFLFWNFALFKGT